MNPKFENKKIALVADWLTDRGGAEHVVAALAKAFPQATIFTSVYNPDAFPEFRSREVRTTFLQKLPTAFRRKHQFLLPFFPMAFEKLDLSGFDIIFSSASSGFSKCVQKTKPEQKHICYCHTPVRFLYHARDEYMREYPLPWWGQPVKLILPLLLNWLTKKDQNAIKNIDFFLSNSDFVGKRIKKFYQKPSTTLYPCIDTKPFLQAAHQHSKQDYFLAVGRFIPYKKFDLLVETFAKNHLPIKLVGSGPELEHCQELAREKNAQNIEFLGFAERARLPGLFARARAFVFPVEEDFGLVPIEAMSAGTPVLYYNRGGATESIGKTEIKCGIAFDHQTSESLQKAIDRFLASESSFDPEEIQKRGEQFDEEIFIQKIHDFLEEKL
ncbi:glycosyltransferase [Candidatus Gracilibacteria bacterium]|nr:glycosyltransferase [Candidatus Gracilibacteria bacterium]MCF7819810.1 glycosyltransferase [Candidatus Gracilibacteria bacterium]